MVPLCASLPGKPAQNLDNSGLWREVYGAGAARAWFFSGT